MYPAISQLEDEGLVSVSPEDGRKPVTLTDTGRRLYLLLAEETGDGTPTS